MADEADGIIVLTLLEVAKDICHLHSRRTNVLCAMFLLCLGSSFETA